MPFRMKTDLNSKIRKGDAPPKGQEARFVRAGLAEEYEIEVLAAKPKAPVRKRRSRAKVQA